MSMFSTDEDRKKFMGAIQEISNSMIRIEAERDLIREIVKEKSDEFSISKKVINKIAKTYHKQNRAQVEAEHEEFMELYDDATKPKSS
jgi:iron-sulfur cluster repair protein YtfE (RIC family)